MVLNKSWGDYYSHHGSIASFLSDVLLHIYYLFKLLRDCRKLYLEVGCGTAYHSIFLSFFVEKCIVLDCDKNVIINARDKIRKFGRGNIDCIIADAFHLPLKSQSLGICFSQGVLEHFDDRHIIILLKEQTRIAKRVYFSVPATNYPTIDFGNERLLDTAKWGNILNNHFKKANVSYYSFDLGIRTRLLIFKKSGHKYLKRIIDCIKSPIHIIGQVED